MIKTTKLIAAMCTAFLLMGGLTLSQPLVSIAYAQALSAKTIVDQAKTDKKAGEQLDGYLGFVKEDVSSDIRAAVNEINITRKSIYTAKAREKNVAVSDIAGLTGEKLVARAKSGEMVMYADKKWHVVQ